MKHALEEVTMAWSNKHYIGHCKATKEEDDQRTAGKESWRK